MSNDPISVKDHSDSRPDILEVVQTRNTWQPLANAQRRKDEGSSLGHG